jgi:hypothetical protein
MLNSLAKKIHLGGSFFIFNFVFSILSIVILFYLLYLLFNAGYNGIQCVYKSNLGHECPTCGFTRSFIDYLKLDFTTGYNRNNISIYYFIFAVYFTISRFLWVIYNFFADTKGPTRRIITLDITLLILAFVLVNLLMALSR